MSDQETHERFNPIYGTVSSVTALRALHRALSGRQPRRETRAIKVIYNEIQQPPRAPRREVASRPYLLLFPGAVTHRARGFT